MYKKGNKIVASLIVFIMLLANMSPIGAQIGVIAADGLNNQDSKTNYANVEFDSYFLDGNNATHESTKNIGEENKIVARISVKDAGYLKDARVVFSDSNFKVSNSESSDKVTKVENNEITLNQINAGENITIELPFTFEHGNKINVDQFDKVSTAKLSGIYVDGKGKTHNIKKDINLGLKWTANTESQITAEITKYVAYNVKDQKGLIMQMLVKESVKDNMLPIKTSNIEIKVPEINGVKPTNVTVFSNENMEFTFDQDSQLVSIVTKNEANEQNEINWADASEREYKVTFIYSDKAVNSDEIWFDMDVKSNIKAYSFDELELDANYNETVSLKDKIGEIVDLKVETTEMVSKGYIYANFNREDKLETPYTQKVTTNISAIQLIDGITLNMASDNFAKGEETIAGNSYYKNLKIAKSQFVEFFGEEGTIDIYSGEDLVATINNEIEDENIVIELNSENVTITSSKPVKEGEFTFEFDKAIKGDEIYSKEQIAEFESINTKTNVQVKNGDMVIVDKTLDNKTALVEPVLQSTLLISDPNLSTVVTNHDIELRAVLKTNSEYNKLFTNPTIVINLPEYIQNINIKNVQVLFDNELTVKSYNLVGNQIVVELEGTQTNYNIGSVYEGTNIVITADLTTDSLTPNRTEKVTMQVGSNDEVITSELDMNFIAPSGVVAVNKISNFADGQEVMALTNDEAAMLEVQTTAKNATEEIQIINNYENKIQNIAILGRTLATQTTDTNNGQNLNNTLDVPMVSPINTNGQENVSVYYSANGNATKDLNNSENGWTTDVQDFSQVKSYLIVFAETTEMNTGDSVKFNYDMQIPENLGYSKTASSQYTVYFDNVQEEQTLEDKVVSRTVTLGTGVAPDLEVQLSSLSEENSVVTRGQYVKFIATIKNTGSIDAENVKLNITAPSGNTEAGTFTTKHVEYAEENFFTGYRESDETEKTIEVGTIKAGKEVKVEYELKIDTVEDLTVVELLDNNGNIYKERVSNESIILATTARAIADKMQKEVTSNEYKLKVEEAELEVLVSRSMSTDSILTKGRELTYSAEVFNTAHTDTIKNVVVKVQIPNGLKIKEANLEDLVDSDNKLKSEYKIDNDKNIVEFTIEEMDPARRVKCNVVTEIDSALGEISAEVTASVNGKEYIGNNLKNVVDKLNFTITQSRLDNSYVKEDEEITFEYVVTNTSEVYTSDFTLESAIPDGMKIVKVETVIGDESTPIRTEEQDGKVIVSRTFKGGQTTIFRITMKANLLPEGQSQKEITSYAKIYGQGFETKESNKVTATIEYNANAFRGEEKRPDDPQNPTVNPEGKKIISGLAWIDRNQDGERNDDEELITGMEVRLLKAENNELINTTVTSSEGQYAFTGLDNGSYLVVFLYDTNKYDLAVYKKAGVSQSTNSDAIDVEMEIAGVNRTVAISDTVRLSDSNARNIDIGVCESNKSDLKLDKYISAITVTYGNTVKTYNYDKSKLAKVEIPANQLSNATVIVEYKIVVTNEGAISNYVKKIVDYVPTDMKFNSELNRDWYQSSNGDVYNSSLANTAIASGESKEVTLTLTKKMTNSNTGIVNNNAELYEVYNEEGIKDFDSTPANKVNGEDDISAADVVIGVKTGDAVIYTVIISVVICAAMAVAIYFIRKSLLRRI